VLDARALLRHETRWNKAGCWRSWSSATATDRRSWRAALIAASVGSRALALVDLLPEAIQQQVREGKIPPTWR